jgi:hypothetical protein
MVLSTLGVDEAADRGCRSEKDKECEVAVWTCGYTVPTMIVVCLVKGVKTSRKKPVPH